MEGSTTTNNTKELIITSCDGAIKGSVEVDETMSMEKVRNLILEEFDSDMLPDTDDDDWVFVVDGIRLAVKQESRRLVSNVIDKDVRIETKMKRKDATTTNKNNKRPSDEAAAATPTISNKRPKLLQNQTAAGSNAIITSKDLPASNNYNNKRTAKGGGSKKDIKEKHNNDDDELLYSTSGSQHSNSKNSSSAVPKSTMVEEGRDENNYNYNDTGRTTGKAFGMSTKLSTTTRPEWKERNEVVLEGEEVVLPPGVSYELSRIAFGCMVVSNGCQVIFDKTNRMLTLVFRSSRISANHQKPAIFVETIPLTESTFMGASFFGNKERKYSRISADAQGWVAMSIKKNYESFIGRTHAYNPEGGDSKKKYIILEFPDYDDSMFLATDLGLINLDHKFQFISDRAGINEFAASLIDHKRKQAEKANAEKAI